MHSIFVSSIFLFLFVDVWCMNRKALISSVGSKHSSRSSSRDRNQDRQQTLVTVKTKNGDVFEEIEVEKQKIFASLMLRDQYENFDKKTKNNKRGSKGKKSENQHLIVDEMSKNDLQLWSKAHNCLSQKALLEHYRNLSGESRDRVISTVTKLHDKMMMARLCDLYFSKDMHVKINAFNNIKPVIRYLKQNWVAPNIASSKSDFHNNTDVSYFLFDDNLCAIPSSLHFKHYSGKNVFQTKNINKSGHVISNDGKYEVVYTKNSITLFTIDQSSKEVFDPQEIPTRDNISQVYFNNNSTGFAVIFCELDDKYSITLSGVQGNIVGEVNFQGCRVSGFTFNADDSKMFCFVEKKDGAEIMAWNISDLGAIEQLPNQLIPLGNDCIADSFYCPDTDACLVTTLYNKVILIDNVFSNVFNDVFYPSLIVSISIPDRSGNVDYSDVMYVIYSESLKWWFVLLSTCSVGSSLYVFDMFKCKTITSTGIIDEPLGVPIVVIEDRMEGLGLLLDEEALIINGGGGKYCQINLLSDDNKYSLHWIKNQAGVFDHLLLNGLFLAYLHKKKIHVEKDDVVCNALVEWTSDEKLCCNIIRHFAPYILLSEDHKKSILNKFDLKKLPSFELEKCTVQ